MVHPQLAVLVTQPMRSSHVMKCQSSRIRFKLWLLHRQTSDKGAAVEAHLLVDRPLISRPGHACYGRNDSRLSAVSVYLHVGRSYFAV